jgi:hypothetical protein
MGAYTKKIIGLAVICNLILTPLIPSEVFAQGTATNTETDLLNDAEQATTTLDQAVENTPIPEPDPWFKLERLSGRFNQGDFVVGPGRTEIVLKPGETVVQQISVSNRISDNRTFSLTVEDVTGTTDGSEAVRLVGEGNGPYSIKEFISIPDTSLQLELGERARIPVTVSVPPNVEPGGYYGSILVSTVQDDGLSNGQQTRQPIVARIGSLFFIRVEGEAFIEGETVEIDTLGSKWWFEEGPIDFGILFENTGSVHLNPAAEISISNLMGEEVGYLEIEPWFVLPNSLRTREFSWDREFLLGRYTVTAQVERGYDDIVDTVTVAFWVLPWRIVGSTFLVIFLLLFSIRAFFRRFEFKRKE